MTGTELKLYSKEELALARTKGQMVGWAQGAGSLIVLGLVLKLVGWIPALLLFAVVGWLLYKLLGKPGASPS